jgi:hypothetical protein
MGSLPEQLGTNESTMSSTWTLSVRTTLTASLEVEFGDRASLVAQLARFDKRGLSDPYRLHEFHNDSGVLIAFISKAYVSHSIVPPLRLVN